MVIFHMPRLGQCTARHITLYFCDRKCDRLWTSAQAWWAVQYAGMVAVSSFLYYIYILVACWSVQAPPGVISAEAYVATLTPTL